jgi:hypothetical protein
MDIANQSVVVLIFRQFFLGVKNEKVNVHTTLWVRASGFEWHVPHKIVWTSTFYVQKRRKIKTTTDC